MAVRCKTCEKRRRDQEGRESEGGASTVDSPFPAKCSRARADIPTGNAEYAASQFFFFFFLPLNSLLLGPRPN